MKNTMIALLVAAAMAMTLAALPALAESKPAVEKVQLAPFSAEDLNGGEAVTEAVYADAKITLLNYWATWCGPCIHELPFLAQIGEETNGNVQVVSVLLDATDQQGGRDEDAIEAMKLLTADAGATFPVLYPEGLLLGVGSMMQSIPTTMVLSDDGTILDVIVGARSLEQWVEIAKAAAVEAYGEGVTFDAK